MARSIDFSSRSPFALRKSQGRGARLISPCAVGGETEEIRVVATERHENRGRHVERDQAEQGTSLLIFPRRCRALPVEELVAAFPDKIVLIAKFADPLRARAFEETSVDRLVIRLRPAPDVLQRFPVFCADLAFRIEPRGGLRYVLCDAIRLFDGCLVASLVNLRTKST